MTILVDARAYLGNAYGPTYDAWMALLDTPATKTLVSAARYLNLLPWQGTFVGTLTLPTDLVWPRSGVVVDGVTVSSSSTPADVLEAQYEMAVLILANPAIIALIDQGSNIKRVGGSGVPEVEYFAPTSARAGTAPRIPVLVLERIGKYLASPTASIEGGLSQPGNSSSSFGSTSQFGLIFPE